MSDGPKISVLMPIHNGMPYLPETVESILGQTYRSFELLAVDDGSSDDTAQYIRSLQDSRVRYHRLNRVGLVEALNYGLQQAQAPLIARMDADDIALPERLERQQDYFSAQPSCVLLGCNYDEIDAQGRVIGENCRTTTADAALRWQMLFGTPFLHPGVAFPRDSALRIGGYCQGYDFAEDYEMWVRLSDLGPIASLQDRLMIKRVHSACISQVNKDIGLTNTSRIAAKYARRLSPELDPAAITELYWFYLYGREPEKRTMRQLVENFQKICELFLAQRGRTAPGLSAAIESARQSFRWRCMHHVQRTWFLPHRALGWTTAMRGFDPEHGTLGNVLIRYVRKRLNVMHKVNC